MKEPDLPRIERQRAMLLQLLLLVVVISVGAGTYLSETGKKPPRYLLPGLSVLSLAGCLYVIARARELESLHRRLVTEVIESRQAVSRLGDDLRCEKIELQSERDRTTELESRLHELGTLYRAIRSINAIAEPARMYGGVLHAALDLVGADVGSLMLVDDSREHLRIVSEQGLDSGVALWTKQKMGDGIAGWVAKNGEAILVSGRAADDERFHNVADRTTPVHRSMCVPLTRHGSVIGVLNLGISEVKPESGFTECDLRLVCIFAEHATMALEHSQLAASRDGELVSVVS